ncbi:MAG: hypothetical protein P8106_11475 [Gammaproteobacteria bacterium]
MIRTDGLPRSRPETPGCSKRTTKPPSSRQAHDQAADRNGLYIARELSEANRIRLEHVPLPARGSCFRLSLPDARNLDRSA